MEIQKVNFNVSYGLRLLFPLGGKLCQHLHLFWNNHQNTCRNGKYFVLLQEIVI